MFKYILIFPKKGQLLSNIVYKTKQILFASKMSKKQGVIREEAAINLCVHVVI